MDPIEIIKQFRKKKNMTQSELSKKLKLPINAWQKIESKNQSLRITDFFKVIKILNIPLSIFDENNNYLISSNQMNVILNSIEQLSEIAKELNKNAL